MRHTKIEGMEGKFLLIRKGDKNARVRAANIHGESFLVATSKLYDTEEAPTNKPPQDHNRIAKKLGIRVPAFVDPDDAAVLARELWDKADKALWSEDLPLYKEVVSAACRMEHRAVK